MIFIEIHAPHPRNDFRGPWCFQSPSRVLLFASVVASPGNDGKQSHPGKIRQVEGWMVENNIYIDSCNLSNKKPPFMGGSSFESLPVFKKEWMTQFISIQLCRIENYGQPTRQLEWPCFAASYHRLEQCPPPCTLWGFIRIQICHVPLSVATALKLATTKTMQTNDNNMLKWGHTSAKSLCYPGMQIFGPYDSCWFGLFRLFPLQFRKMTEHQIAIFILAHFGTFREFQPCFDSPSCFVPAHVPNYTPSFARSRATPICIFNRCRWIFFTPWLWGTRNVRVPNRKTNGPLNGWNTKWLSWISVNSISIQFLWSWAMLGHHVDWRIVGAGVSFCLASVLKHVSN